MTRELPPLPRLVLGFTGKLDEFQLFLEALASDHYPIVMDDEETEWLITASIARHPAGKGLRAGDDR
jgi:hypothetical protein